MIKFVKPIFLMLLVLIPIFIFLSYRFNDVIKNKKFKGLILLRSIIIFILVLALSNPVLNLKLRESNTIFLVDLSESNIQSKSSMETFIKDALKEKPKGDKAGIMSFGSKSVVEQFPKKDIEFNKIYNMPESDSTNVEDALKYVISLLGEGISSTRVVILTDEEENRGSSSNVVPVFKSENTEVKVFSIKNEKKQDVSIEEVDVPSKASIDQEFNITVTIKSTVATSATLNLMLNGEKIKESNVNIEKGENKFVIKDKILSSGLNKYQVSIDPANDSQKLNNDYSFFVNGIDKPKVLLVEESIGEADEILKILESINVECEIKNASSAPSTLEDMNRFRAIFLVNTSRKSLPEGFMNNIETYVKDLGRGFIAIGGENSYALGEYRGTKVEEVLPVLMDPNGKKEIPKVCMMIIIDRSGSMSEKLGLSAKLDTAKMAALATVDSLRDSDDVGVIFFDDLPTKFIEIQNASNKEELKKKIYGVSLGGGTSILPALNLGYEEIKRSDAKYKHIILLTDGQAETTGYDDVINKMKGDNITLSTVAVGQGSDQNLLSSLAKMGEGRYYYADANTDIPRIFAKETFMAYKEFLNNRAFLPVVSSSHEILSGIDLNMPMINGYVATGEKPNSSVILRSDEDDPLLSAWQIGLGRSVAWTSDLNGNWSKDLLGWKDLNKLFNNIIEWTIGDFEEDGAGYIKVLDNVGEGKLIYSSEGLNNKEIVGKVIYPSGKQEEKVLSQSDIDEFSNNFELLEKGIYSIVVTEKEGDNVVNSKIGAFAKQYSPEYKIGATTDEFDKFKKLSSAIDIFEPKDVFNTKLNLVSSTYDLTWMLVTCGLLLFMLDIINRRLGIKLTPVTNFLLKFKNKINITTNPIKDKAEKVKNLEKANLSKIEVEKSKKEKEPVLVKEEETVDTLDSLMMKKRKRDNK